MYNKTNKKVIGFEKKFRWFSKSNENRILAANFGNFDHSCKVTHKIWAWSVQPFWRLLDTNKQTDKQNLYIDILGAAVLNGQIVYCGGYDGGMQLRS